VKRWTVTLATLVAMWSSTTPAHAEQKTRTCPNMRPPLRSRIESVGVWVKTNGPGYPAYRYTYRGAKDGFPPPAWLFYGYPHSGDETGLGF
jgi:hypothetical protein